MPDYAEILLPFKLDQTFTYSIPDNIGNVKPGQRVEVSFRKRKRYAGLVWHIHDKKPKFNVKAIHEILDDKPIINDKHQAFWNWIAKYYCCTLGEVMNAALPSALLWTSHTCIALLKKEDSPEDLSERELEVYHLLRNQELKTAGELKEKTGFTDLYSILEKLMSEGVIAVEEVLKRQYKPLKRIHYYPQKDFFTDEDSIEDALQLCTRSQDQSDLVLRIYDDLPEEPLTGSQLEKKYNTKRYFLDALAEKGILTKEELPMSRIIRANLPKRNITLTASQKAARKKLSNFLYNYSATLLHGVTSSGKTEIYTELAKEVLSSDQQVLYLLPEIALTTQLSDRLISYFGEKVFLYHSSINDAERVEIWRKVREGEPILVIGARSATFLPFVNPGLIIVDEEHERSYKQYDPAPRYHARDTAIYLGRILNCPVLLGSATPLIETYAFTKNDKYGYARLKERYGHFPMPDMRLIDLREAGRKKRLKGLFSLPLLDAIKATIEKDQQVILFHNRRGYAPLLKCLNCNYTPECINCDVTLTYHQYQDHLRCHYCGYVVGRPKVCPSCQQVPLDDVGFGTQRIEEELNKIQPVWRVKRLDQDTTGSMKELKSTLYHFEKGNIDILVGTQMLSKGMDFPSVGLVGIMHADQLWHFPDYRATEQAYQRIYQVAGRAGRATKNASVLIQTYEVQHPLFKYILKDDWKRFYSDELEQREAFQYPPYTRLILLKCSHEDQKTAARSAQILADKLNGYEIWKVLGPAAPQISRIRGFYLQHLMLKLPRDMDQNQKAKELLGKIIRRLSEEVKDLNIIINVDP